MVHVTTLFLYYFLSVHKKLERWGIIMVVHTQVEISPHWGLSKLQLKSQSGISMLMLFNIKT